MITLSKIAKEAHVSVSTASKAFSGSSEVNEETRQLIFDVAKRNGCFKKFYNAKYPSLVIAVIAPEFNSIHYTRHLSFLQENLPHCQLLVSATGFDPDREKELVDYYYKHSEADGILVLEPRSNLTGPFEIPVVLLSAKEIETECTLIRHSFCDALEHAVAYLRENKVSSVGFIGEKLTERKLLLLRDLLEKNGMPLSEKYVSVSQKRFEEGGYLAMEALFERGEVPRALICGYDNMAIGAMRCIRDHKLRIPEDVAILGMDDIPEAKYLDPPLASVSSSVEEMCRAAAENILTQLGGGECRRGRKISSVFFLRRSFELS